MVRMRRSSARKALVAPIALCVSFILLVLGSVIFTYPIDLQPCSGICSLLHLTLEFVVVESCNDSILFIPQLCVRGFFGSLKDSNIASDVLVLPGYYFSPNGLCNFVCCGKSAHSEDLERN